MQNTLPADQEITAQDKYRTPATIGVPDLRSGAQRLDVRFAEADPPQLTSINSDAAGSRPIIPPRDRCIRGSGRSESIIKTE